MRKLIIGIVFLLGLGLVADFGAAAYAEYRVSRELRTGASLESDPEVTFNGFPFLTQALGGKYKDVYVRATGVQSDVVGEVTVEADLRGVTVPFSDIVNGNVTQLPVDKLDGRMGINATDLGKLLNIPDLQVSSPPANKSDGTGGSGGTGASTAGAVVLTGTVAVGPVETAVSVQANLVLEGGQVKIVASNLYFGPEGKADFSIPAALEPVVLGLFSYTIDPQALPYGNSAEPGLRGRRKNRDRRQRRKHDDRSRRAAEPMTGITILLVALVAVVAVGLFLKSRNGKVRVTAPAAAGAADSRLELLRAAGVSSPNGGPVVLHFSADWCGPCAAVRRVVGQVVISMADAPRPPVEIELDIDKEPALAREMSVLSLPTTFILDGGLEEQFRVSGVPSAADLKAALVPLSGPHEPKSENSG